MEETPKSEDVSPSKGGSTKSGVIKGTTKSDVVSGLTGSEVVGALSAFEKFRAKRDLLPTGQLANYKLLVARAVDVFGDEIKASQWLSLPNPELNGETPLQVAQRHNYDEQVLEPIFTLIEHGIYF
jgi:hypothetical protein